MFREVGLMYKQRNEICFRLKLPNLSIFGYETKKQADIFVNRCKQSSLWVGCYVMTHKSEIQSLTKYLA